MVAAGIRNISGGIDGSRSGTKQELEIVRQELQQRIR